MNLEDVARAVYAAYGETTGHKNYQGDPMPEWADLGDTIQQAWLAGTRVAYRAGFRDSRDRLDSLALD